MTEPPIDRHFEVGHQPLLEFSADLSSQGATFSASPWSPDVKQRGQRELILHERFRDDDMVREGPSPNDLLSAGDVSRNEHEKACAPPSDRWRQSANDVSCLRMLRQDLRLASHFTQPATCMVVSRDQATPCAGGRSSGRLIATRAQSAGSAGTGRMPSGTRDAVDRAYRRRCVPLGVGVLHRARERSKRRSELAPDSESERPERALHSIG